MSIRYRRYCRKAILLIAMLFCLSLGWSVILTLCGKTKHDTETILGEAEYRVLLTWGIPSGVFDPASLGTISQVGSGFNVRTDAVRVYRYRQFGYDIYIDQDGNAGFVTEIVK